MFTTIIFFKNNKCFDRTHSDLKTAQDYADLASKNEQVVEVVVYNEDGKVL